MTPEIPLTGGNVALRVVRVGSTLRKPPAPQFPAVAALLDCYATAGIEETPRWLGRDAAGRCVFSFLEGKSVASPWSESEPLQSAARLLRRMHDAAAPLLDRPLPWARRTEPAEVICHSDFAPYNMVWGPDHRIAGVFDMDLAGPGPRLWDLAYLAWWLVPLGGEEAAMHKAAWHDRATGSPRLRAIATAYDAPADAALLDMVARVLIHMGDQDAAAGMIGAGAADRLAAEGHLAHWQRAAADFAVVRASLAANLRRPGN